jgi:hypothetical protein
MCATLDNFSFWGWGRRTLTKYGRSFLISTRMILLAGIILLSWCQARAWTDAAPNEAIFFDDPNFQGPSLAVRLEPGMRQALKPALGALDKKISSIILGEKVKVLVFTRSDFRGAVRMYTDTIAENMPDNDDISSLIVCPKEESPQGVLFIQKRLSEVKTTSPRPWHYITGQGIFFPLPEAAKESEASFRLVAPEWDNQVRYVSISPAVEAKFFDDPEFKGRSLLLPCADCGPQTVFDLRTYGFYDPKKSPPGVISSLIIKTRESDKK